MKKSTVTLIVGGVVGMMAALLTREEAAPAAPDAEGARPADATGTPTQGSEVAATAAPESPPRTRIPPRCAW